MGAVSCRESQTQGDIGISDKSKRHTSGVAVEDEVVQQLLCKEEDLQDNEMKVFDIGENRKVLLIKQNGEFSALGTKCTHYGAPLVKGVLSNGRVRCPWHGACFNSKTGDIEDFPGLDSLPQHEVRVVDGEVHVHTKRGQLEIDRRRRVMCRRDLNNNTTVVVVGGGAAAQVCIETLRQEGFLGRVVMVTKENHLPYDRPKLSKALHMEASKIALRSPEFYQECDIEVLTGTEAVGLDLQSQSVKLDSGENLKYNSLLVATGGKPRVLNTPGFDLQGVCLLRTPSDANYIHELSQGKNVVIIGTSFIGMEVAAYLVDKASTVSVIGTSDIPFKAALGKDIGKAIMNMHEEKGVKFYMETQATEFLGEEGKLSGVVLQTGETLPADVCIVGVGVVPSTEFLKNSGLEMDGRGSVVVDKFLKSSDANVFAAGDIAAFPLFMANGQRVTIGHWQMAHSLGRTAALNILGKQKEVHSVPFFWTVMFGKSIRYAGHCIAFDDVIINGNLNDQKFAAYYCRGDRVTAVCTLACDPIAARFAEFLDSGKVISKATVEGDPENWFQQF